MKKYNTKHYRGLASDETQCINANTGNDQSYVTCGWNRGEFCGSRSDAYKLKQFKKKPAKIQAWCKHDGEDHKLVKLK